MPYRLGRNRPKAPAPKLRLGNYLLSKFPAAPEAVDYSAKSMPFLKDILGNDNNGCCTVAAAYHIGATLLANAGVPIPSGFNVNNCLALYYKLTGGPDTGLDEQVVFNWWQAHGLLPDGSAKISQRVFVDTTNEMEVKAAIWLFEHIYIVAELPDAWVSPFPSGDGFNWALAGQPDPENGHAFCAFSYQQGGVGNLDSWGLMGNMPMSSLAYYAKQSEGGGCYAVLSQDAIDKGTSKAPNGFDWSQLQADVASFQT